MVSLKGFIIEDATITQIGAACLRGIDFDDAKERANGSAGGCGWRWFVTEFKIIQRQAAGAQRRGEQRMKSLASPRLGGFAFINPLCRVVR